MRIKFGSNKTILVQKLRESLASVLPIAGIVFILCFTILPVPVDILMAFVIGTVMVILGMSMFTLGTDISMTPVGEHVGSAITKSRKLWFIIFISFLVGAIITIAEPDLTVLAQQVNGIDNFIIIGAVAIGVGIFLVLAMLRILFGMRLSYILILAYALVFILALFVPGEFLPVAFDSGGVTTGPMTVPFIMALGVGVASIRADKNAENDSFGLVALCSVGPILAVMILGMIADVENTQNAVSQLELNIESSKELWQMFSHELPEYIKEVSMALLPIMLFFLVFQIFKIKLKKDNLIRISVGFVYTYVGLVIFLCGVNVGFMPMGNFIGAKLGELSYNWIIIPIGMIIGYFIVAAEPAVHVLNKQVHEITSGAIAPKALSASLSVGVSVSVGLAMLRIVCGIPVMYMLVPGYLLAIILSFITPPIFTAIAFDSGGVASGPMTATFLLPLATGACGAIGRDMASFAFGVVAMVAMTPLITIQVLGLIYTLKSRALEKRKAELYELCADTGIIEMEEEF